LKDIRKTIERGTRFTKALSLYPQVFDTMFVRMLEAGEMSGRLGETLERLATYLESVAELRRKARSAMMYPVVVAGIAMLIFTGMMIWIVPGFERIYQDLGGSLPQATQIMVAISRLLRDNIIVVAAGFTAAMMLISTIVRRTEAGAYAWDSLVLRLPVFGDLLLKIGLSHFSESVSQMLRNGVPILTALDIGADTVGNKVIARGILEAKEAVSKGYQMSTTLAKKRFFPGLLTRMVAVGEKTGKIDDMLEKVAKFYRSEAEAMLNGLTSLIEPMLMVGLGLLVGGMVVSMFLPIFRLHEIVAF
jgi:type IV pilus assembly protein PilC